MQKVIELANLHGNIYSENIDVYQVIYNGFLRNDFFPWVLILFFTINKGNWKRPVTIVLIVHWILRSCGDVIFNFIPLREYIPDHYWPYSTENWYKSAALGNVFWLTGEIIADWYPLLRTKAVTNNNRGKIKYVYITCILYNIIKVVNIYCYFIDYPINLSIKDENGNVVTEYAMFKIRWWIIIFIMNIISCAYDISVILALRKCIFNKLKEFNNFNENSFISKFKQVSEFRIICSMIASIIFLPVILLFVIYLLNTLNRTKDEPNIPSDESIDNLRRVVINVNYNLMYIDQILLRIFAERSNSKKPSSTYIYGSSSTIKSNYSNPSMNISSPVSNKTYYNQSYDNSKTNLIEHSEGSDIINIYNNSDSYYKEYIDNNMNRKNNKYQNGKNTYNDSLATTTNNNSSNNNNYRIKENYENNSMNGDNKYQNNANISSKRNNYLNNNDMYSSSSKNSNYLNNNDMYYSESNNVYYTKNGEIFNDNNKYSRTLLEEKSSPPTDSLLLKKFGETLNTAKYKPIIRDDRSNQHINTKPLDGYYFNNNYKYTTFN